jgi:hypothetical protein
MLSGQVSAIDEYVKGKPRRYEIRLEVSKRNVMVTAHTTAYFPLFRSDMVYGRIRPLTEHETSSLRRAPSSNPFLSVVEPEKPREVEYIFTDPPRVEIVVLPTTVEDYCGRALGKKRYREKMDMYHSILHYAKSEDKIVDFVHDWASRYILHRSKEILLEVAVVPGVVRGIEEYVAKSFLSLWYRDNLDRQLILLGIETKEREDYPYTILDMIKQLQKNPYVVPQITLVKAQHLQESTPEKILCGEIVRWLWNDHFSFGHSYTEEAFLLKAYPNITPAIATLLTSEYRILCREGKIYFDYAYAAERVIIDNVLRLAPLSFPPLPLHFDDRISEEQKRAVELVTSQGVSILTGGPGTGKCLAPYVEVRMYRGDTKRAEQVKVGDLLRGMDDVPRVVVATGTGYGQMYRVASLDGSLHFTCNDEHVLTIMHDGIIKDVPLLEYPSGALLLSIDGRTHTFTIEKAPHGPFSGFEVDGDGRYVLANGLVTHNTTILRTIIENYDKYARPYELVSFTGKAVARANQVLKRLLARTIHRNLGSYKNEGVSIIVEEGSMVSSHLLAKLLQHHIAVQIIFVGDPDQLFPSSWGSPMVELIKSKRIPTVTLTANYRQGSDAANGIIINTNLLRLGKDFDWVPTNNFNIVEGDLAEVLGVISFLHNNGVTYDKMTVLTPYTTKFTHTYTDVAKHMQQLYLSTNQNVKDSTGRSWFMGDRVMLTKNITPLEIYNGMEGVVVCLGVDRITVDFGELNGRHDFLLQGSKTFGEEASGDEKTVSVLVHAYCLSIDKSQGSEYEVVIFYIPYHATPSSFLNRNRTYVALSRGKKHVIYVGKLTTLTASARRKAPSRRNSIIASLSSLPAIETQAMTMQEEEDDYCDIIDLEEVY